MLIGEERLDLFATTTKESSKVSIKTPEVSLECEQKSVNTPQTPKRYSYYH